MFVNAFLYNVAPPTDFFDFETKLFMSVATMILTSPVWVIVSLMFRKAGEPDYSTKYKVRVWRTISQKDTLRVEIVPFSCRLCYSKI